MPNDLEYEEKHLFRQNAFQVERQFTLPLQPHARMVSKILLHDSSALVVIFLVFGVVLLLLLSLPLADLAGVGLFAVDLGEDEIKHFRVPANGMTLNAFLDCLQKGRKISKLPI